MLFCLFVQQQSMILTMKYDLYVHFELTSGSQNLVLIEVLLKHGSYSPLAQLFPRNSLCHVTVGHVM